MESLIIKRKGHAIVKIVVGLVFTALGTYNIISNPEENTGVSWIINILMIILGISNFTPYSGSSTTSLVTENNGMKIRWRGWALWKYIRKGEVEKIVLGRPFILIFRRDKKPVRLELDSFEKDQKKDIYNFFISYSQRQNLPLEQHGQNQKSV